MKRCVSTSLLIIWDFPGFRKNLLILYRVYQISWIIENLVKIFFSLSSREEVTLHYNYVYNEKIKQFSLKGWLYLGIFYFVWIICVQILNLSQFFWQRLVHVQSSLRLLIITWNNSVYLISLKWEHFSCNMRENYK